MKILITGKEGQVARCLADKATDHPALDLVFAARSGTEVVLDLAEPETIRAAVRGVRPDVILNAAAYTGVDQAEDEPELAMAINGVAPGILAQEAAALGARIIQISTDYVFDGEKDSPYLPSDPVNPIGVYGKTKLAGEEAVRAATPDFLIVRTAWVYSSYGENFYKTMLRLAETRDKISVVDDQIGNPTSAYDIADGLLAICADWAAGGRKNLGETIHLVGPKAMTWCSFARQIFAESAATGGPSCQVKAITTADYPTKAKRPRNSRLL
ncbi:dTDP-4-dehydrorhamnose reductase [Roseibium aggregatum]|uniref:dTDP-4-dehydrorhamnose reductase n=1 Tax=Roseibium aggregatum TaxID=187304 RepID=A0A926P4E6_9HYPH|nr:dTDP-4-dehydrorhamnose reductase [Roseibium aggregatum]MBD1549740.1 dTDP-4-dehydrorhamnose reductase [Roseibium aggregatum]